MFYQVAEDPHATRARFVAEMEKLAEPRAKVVDLGAPRRVLEHKNMFEHPARFLETLKNKAGGDDG